MVMKSRIHNHIIPSWENNVLFPTQTSAGPHQDTLEVARDAMSSR